MTQDYKHPITPPPELVKQWLGTYFGTTVTGEVSSVELALANQAAQWGADQELQACCEWLDKGGWPGLSLQLCGARRPEPLSLKEQALAQLSSVETDLRRHGIINTDYIRRALEALPE